MTIMNYALSPNRALLLSDALVTDARTGLPCAFSTKVRVVPHLQLMMSAKGAAAPMVALWRALMEGGPLDFSVEQVAAVARPLLVEAYADVRPLLEEDECTVFLFGWSDRVVGYAFPFETGFQPEPLGDGFRLIPPLPTMEDEPTDWTSTALRQQAADRDIAPTERDNIGGWLIAHQLVAKPGEDRVSLIVENLGRLPHFESDVAAMMAKATSACA